MKAAVAMIKELSPTREFINHPLLRRDVVERFQSSGMNAQIIRAQVTDPNLEQNGESRARSPYPSS